MRKEESDHMCKWLFSKKFLLLWPKKEKMIKYLFLAWLREINWFVKKGIKSSLKFYSYGINLYF